MVFRQTRIPMALKSTIHKVELNIVDLDRNYYATHELTLARHPSESEERMMIGLVAFALNAGERLEFSRGLGETEEPDLWQRDLTGELKLWIELGHPDDRRLAKACGISRRVIVYTYSASPGLWWEPIADRLAKWRNLETRRFDPTETAGLRALVRRSMSLTATIQDGEVWLRDEEGQECHLGCRPL
jgi:uncharacterized protein YaeQ